MENKKQWLSWYNPSYSEHASVLQYQDVSLKGFQKIYSNVYENTVFFLIYWGTQDCGTYGSYGSYKVPKWGVSNSKKKKHTEKGKHQENTEFGAACSSKNCLKDRDGYERMCEQKTHLQPYKQDKCFTLMFKDQETYFDLVACSLTVKGGKTDSNYHKLEWFTICVIEKLWNENLVPLCGDHQQSQRERVPAAVLVDTEAGYLKTFSSQIWPESLVRSPPPSGRVQGILGYAFPGEEPPVQRTSSYPLGSLYTVYVTDMTFLW